MQTEKYILEESMGFNIGRAGRALGNRLNRNFQEAGLEVTREQWIVLVTLADHGGLTQQELANMICKDKTTITRTLTNMEKANLLLRVPSDSDRRSKRLYLTNEGKKHHQQLVSIAQKTLGEAQEGISTEELEACKGVLRKIFSNLTSL